MRYAELMQPIIEKETEELKKLLKNKTQGYGPSWQVTAKMLEALFPRGIKPEAYEDVLLIVRVTDKLCRLATAIESGKGDAGGEDPWQDISGYGIVGKARREYRNMSKSHATKGGKSPGSDGNETW